MDKVQSDIYKTGESGKKKTEKSRGFKVSSRNGIEDFQRKSVRSVGNITSKHHRDSHFSGRTRKAEKKACCNAVADDRQCDEKEILERWGSAKSSCILDFFQIHALKSTLDGTDEKREAGDECCKHNSGLRKDQFDSEYVTEEST